MAVIYARHGKEAEIARTLLALADDVQDVKTNTDHGFAFIVPDDLYERYLASFEVPEETPADVEQAKRRPGRPRKSVPAAEPEGD
jgi:hypothetical protein